MKTETAQRVQSVLMSLCGFAIASKASSLWNVVAMTIDAIRLIFGLQIVSGADFIEHYATTILGIVALPKEELDPVQLVLLLVHEATHVRQWYEDILKFPIWYLQHPEKRAAYEAGAIGQALAVYWAMYHALPPKAEDLPSAIVAGYALKPQDIALAQSLLEQEATSISQGILPMGPARIALREIYRLQPELIDPRSLALIRENSKELT